MAGEGKSYLVMDGSYLFKGSIRFRGLGLLDYQLLCKCIAEQVGVGPNADGTYFTDRWYFNSSPEPARPAQRSFNQYLQRVPPEGPKFKLRLFPMKKHTVSCPQTKSKHETLVQKGVDVAIATKMMELVFEHKPARIVLIAGDGDFLEAVKTATRHHIEIIIAGYRDRSVSSDLQSEAQRVVWLDEQWNRMVRVNAGSGPQNIPAVEELIVPDMLGYVPDQQKSPPLPGADMNETQVIAPETFDVLARILSLGDQAQPGSQPNYPPAPLLPPSSSSIPPRDNRGSARPRPAPTGQRHYRDDYAARSRQRSLSPPRRLPPSDLPYRRDRYDEHHSVLPPSRYDLDPYFRPPTPPRPNVYEHPPHYEHY